MGNFEISLSGRRKRKWLQRRVVIALRTLIRTIFGLLALLSICVMPLYAAGPGAYGGSGGFQGHGDFHGPGNFHGRGDFHGHGYFHGHGNSFNAHIFIGPGWGPWWWVPPTYPYYSYYPAQPAYIEQQPQAYSQQDQQEPDYWYYCQDPQGYYPYVKSCPDGWMKVVPNTGPPPG